MKKQDDDFEMRDEYDFTHAIRNSYVQRFQQLNLVSLDDDVKAAFPDSDAVNDALRLLMKAGLAATEDRKRQAS